LLSLLLCSLLAGLLFSSPAEAAQTVPYKINFQGRLADASGNAKANGQYNMTFRLYADASGGAAVWTEVREQTNRVAVTNGQFNVQLGDVTALSPSILSDSTLFFEIELPTPATVTCSTASCASYTEGAMGPRQPLSSGAFAMNADQIDGIDGSSLARNDATNTFSAANTFNGANTFAAANTFNSTVTIGSANSSSKFVINDNSSVALFTADTSSTIVKVGTTSAATLSNVRLLTTSAEFTGTVRIGTATDGVDISSANGVLLSGTARRATSINLMPEYANSVLDAGSGSNNTGSMTSKLDLTNRRNYYKWTTTQGTAQSYDVVVQVPIPSDFSAWASTTPISVDTYTSNTSTGPITIEARDTAGAVVSGINFAAITPTAATAWQTRSAGTISGTYTAGGYMTLRIRMVSPTSGDVRISNIKMDYLSKW
jgi:hypothetical protein